MRLLSAPLSKSVFFLVMGLCLALSISSCSKREDRQTQPEAGDTAVAKFENITIWASDVRQEAVAQGEIGEGEPLDMTSDLFRRTLEDVIDRHLMAEEARAKGLDKSLLAQRRLIAAQDRILADILVENTVNRAIDDAKVKNLYDEQVKLSQKSEEIRARLIVLKTREEAESVLKALQGGAILEALAMERSIDQSTRFNGGDMGYFTTDMMPQAFKGVLSNASIGAIVGPVETDGGWAVLRVEDRRPEQILTLEESRPQIVRYLTFDQLRILLNKLRDKTKVQYLVKSSPGKGLGEDQAPASAPKEAFIDQSAEASAAASDGAAKKSASSSSKSR